MTYNLTLYAVKAFFILDAVTGNRILVKYYPPPLSALPNLTSATPIKEPFLFEKKLFEKTKKLNST
ncbi:hypothetical protein HMI55_003668 [Coelomomyces lativittatus]|nr:hypothetical protein HMI55_003668 [Coelomomyces lativittatus]